MLANLRVWDSLCESLKVTSLKAKSVDEAFGSGHPPKPTLAIAPKKPSPIPPLSDLLAALNDQDISSSIQFCVSIIDNPPSDFRFVPPFPLFLLVHSPSILININIKQKKHTKNHFEGHSRSGAPFKEKVTLQSLCHHQDLPNHQRSAQLWVRNQKKTKKKLDHHRCCVFVI